MVERAASPHVAQLLHRALQRADSVFAQSVGRYALTRSQFAILNAVKQSGGGGTQSALVKVTGIDRSSIADLVGRLVKRGLPATMRRSLTLLENVVPGAATESEVESKSNHV